MNPPFKYLLRSDYLGDLELKYDPVGWDDQNYIMGRDLRYHGIFHEVSVDLKFVKDSREYVKKVYEDKGVEAIISLFIFQFNRRLNKYDPYFEGVLSLDMYKEEELYVSCTILSAGITQKFKNRDEVKVNLESLKSIGDMTLAPFTNETVNVSMHSKVILKRYEATSSKDVDDMDDNANDLPIGQNFAFPIPTYQIVTNTKYVTLGFPNTIVDEIPGINEGVTTKITEDPPFFMYKVVEPGTYKIKLDLNYLIRVSAFTFDNVHLRNCNDINNGGGVFDDVRIDLFLENLRGTTLDQTTIRTSTGNRCGLYEFSQDDAFTYEITKDLLIDDELYLYFKARTSSEFHKHAGGTQNLRVFTDATMRIGSKITITGLTQSPVPTSPARSLLLHEVFARVCQSILDKADPFRSTLYGRTDSQPVTYTSDGEGALRVITNGFQIRQFPITEKPIYASFKDLYDTFDAIDNIGVGIENDQVVVEKKSYFYSSQVLMTIDNVDPSNYSKSIAKEYYYNEAEIGYQKWENEETNGLDEFNGSRQYVTFITSIKNKLSKLAPYLASGYAIEFTRRKPFATTSTEDWKYDNDNFVVVVRRNGTAFEADRDQDFDSSQFENILDPATAYNLKISPKRMFLNSSYLIRAGLEKYLDKFVKFAFGSANYKMKSKETVEPAQIVENGNILNSDLAAPLWLPEYYEFQAPVRNADLQTIKTNPYGVIQFSTSTSNYTKGYIVSLKVDAEKNLGTFKLLRANL